MRIVMNIAQVLGKRALSILRNRVDLDDVLGGFALFALLVIGIWITYGAGLAPATEALIEVRP